MLPNSSLPPIISEVTGRLQAQELTEGPLQRHPPVAVAAMDQRSQPAVLDSGTPTPAPDTAPPPAQRPQAFRRPHHKSRLGCVQCKQRKIKVNTSLYCQLDIAVKSLLCQVLYTRSCDAVAFYHVNLVFPLSLLQMCERILSLFCKNHDESNHLPDDSQLTPLQCDENKPSCDKCTRYNTPCSFLTLQPSRPSLDQPKSSTQFNSSFPSSQSSSRTSPYPPTSVIPQYPKEHPQFSMMDLEFLHHCTHSTPLLLPVILCHCLVLFPCKWS